MPEDSAGSQQAVKRRPEPPVFEDPMGDEWANTLTHAGSLVIALIGWAVMLYLVIDKPLGMQLACLAYATSAVAVFLFSTLSHAVYEPWMRQRMRAWDQGTIYLMISGTYTPFAYLYGGKWQVGLLIFLWVVAGFGFLSKVGLQHRVHGITTTTYLALGWAPAIVLAPQVPFGCMIGMALGGVIYTLGVVFLVLDQRRKFFHGVWHVMVLLAAAVHYGSIVRYVALA